MCTHITEKRLPPAIGYLLLRFKPNYTFGVNKICACTFQKNLHYVTQINIGIYSVINDLPEMKTQIKFVSIPNS